MLYEVITRWQPLNSEGRHLAFSPPPGEESEQNMALLDMGSCAGKVLDWWQSWSD